MSTVIPRPNESIDSLLRRFKKVVDRSGVLSDLRRREAYEKPSVKRKRKAAAARKRAAKQKAKMSRRTKVKNQNFRWNEDKTQKIPLRPRPPQEQMQRKPGNGKRPNPGFKKFDKKPRNKQGPRK